jgi:hypothetical protein
MGDTEYEEKETERRVKRLYCRQCGHKFREGRTPQLSRAVVETMIGSFNALTVFASATA